MQPASNPPRGRASEKGSALVVVMILLIALLGAGAVAVRLQTADTRSTGLVRQARDSLFCAEAGIAFARETVANWGTAGLWDDILKVDPADPDDPDLANAPDGYPIEGDFDGDGETDFTVTVQDNDDGDNNFEADSDQRLFIVSRCTRQPNAPTSVMEMVRFDGTPNAYRDQAGQGAWGTNNAN